MPTLVSALDYEALASDTALEGFLRSWWDGTLPRARWTHAAHVAVSASLAYDFAPDVAYRLTRSGIIEYSTSVGVVHTETSGYHETLTRFWSQVIGAYVSRGRFNSRLDAVRAAVDTFGDRQDLHWMFYTYDVVADRRARREWVPPDRVEIAA